MKITRYCSHSKNKKCTALKINTSKAKIDIFWKKMMKQIGAEKKNLKKPMSILFHEEIVPSLTPNLGVPQVLVNFGSVLFSRRSLTDGLKYQVTESLL